MKKINFADKHYWKLIRKRSKVAPKPTANHCAAVVGNEMYVVCGGTEENLVPTNEVWSFDLRKCCL